MCSSMPWPVGWLSLHVHIVYSLRERQQLEEARQRKQLAEEVVKVKTAGCVLHFSGCGPNTTREDLKVPSLLQELGSCLLP